MPPGLAVTTHSDGGPGGIQDDVRLGEKVVAHGGDEGTELDRGQPQLAGAQVLVVSDADPVSIEGYLDTGPVCTIGAAAPGERSCRWGRWRRFCRGVKHHSQHVAMKRARA